jgi:hypothetical protein
MIMSGGDRHQHHQDYYDDNDGNEKALDFSTIEVTEDVNDKKLKETLIFKDKLHSTSNDNYDDNGMVVKGGKVDDDNDTDGIGYHHEEVVDDGSKEDGAGLMKAYRSSSQRQAFISDLIKVSSIYLSIYLLPIIHTYIHQSIYIDIFASIHAHNLLTVTFFQPYSRIVVSPCQYSRRMRFKMILTTYPQHHPCQA